MSNMYAIKASTLTAIGDAIRSRTGEMRPGIVDLIQYETINLQYAFSTVTVALNSASDKNVKSIKFRLISGDKSLLSVLQVYYMGKSNKFTLDENNECLYIFGDDYQYSGANFQLMSNRPTTVEFEISYCDANGNIVQAEGAVPNSMTPLQMAEQINNMPVAPTKKELTITGNCNYMFYQGEWDWFIKKFGDEIITENIDSCISMFYGCKTDILFDINANPSVALDMSNMFNSYTGTVVPKILGAKLGKVEGLFSGSKMIVEIPNDYFDSWDFSYVDNLTSQYTGQMNSIFNNCACLRKMPLTIFEHGNPVVNTTYSVLTGTFYSCYVLDEIIDMPYPHINGTYNQTGYSGVISSNFVENTHRLKNFTFRKMPAVKWANQTLDLSKYSGWAQYSGRITDTGITTDKRVKDDATYQALKDDPDYWTTDVAYSRYNHDSAVRTINSLPSAIEYQTTNNQKANIVKFKGAAGSATDGGAINTLTEEEIAVAAAKGWTVSLV